MKITTAKTCTTDSDEVAKNALTAQSSVYADVSKIKFRYRGCYYSSAERNYWITF